MTEKEILTPASDGDMPTYIAMPDGPHQATAVLIYMDGFGPREELYAIARRYATCGYVAVLPHLFYRLGSPTFLPTNVKGQKPQPEQIAANDATTLELVRRDTRALFDYAAKGGLGRKIERWGVIGFCMGGRHAIAAAAEFPDYVGAALSVHGGRMVNNNVGLDGSSHLLIQQCRVPVYVACAKGDPSCPSEHQRMMSAEAAKTNGQVTVETLDALHGWSFPARWCFDRRASDWIWEKSLTMFDTIQ
ncbi:dienelactone hydrolase family protein [Paraburkholderia agricolaris]|uniref:Dienelactone hydrolase family protein n=1 Tax=Paraburkholderia agricolaris TaxID=2152888 RepID=A0ABW8ZZ06_9BURK